MQCNRNKGKEKEMKKLRAGIDIGSTTVKLVILDEDNKIENEEITSIDSMINLVDKYKDKSEIKINLLRDGKTLTTNLSLKIQ